MRRCIQEENFTWDRAAAVLNIHVRRQVSLLEFKTLCPPDEAAIAQRIMKSKEAARGSDGALCAAYKALPEASGKVLAATSSDMSEPAHTTDLINSDCHLVWFAPKWAAGQDGVAVLRTLDNLRRIFGSDASSKRIAGRFAGEITPPALDERPVLDAVSVVVVCLC